MKTETMIERVARAIASRYPQVQAHNDEEIQLIIEASPELARAAIEELREPTEAMVEAGLKHGGEYMDGDERKRIRLTWQAMNNAALEEGGAGCGQGSVR